MLGPFQRISLVTFLLALSHGALGGPLDRLPFWPVTNIGEGIPLALIQLWSGGGAKDSEGQPKIAKWCPGHRGQYDAFPSKTPRPIPDQSELQKNLKNEGEDERDPNTRCDDGDQTMYNGMLCAAGFEAGCRAVAQAQDRSGRWFRSPHRRWMWTARCGDLLGWEKQNVPNKFMLYQKRCAYGFSPDMNLGVLLYVLTKRDSTAYRNWLNWLDRNAETTKLCKGDGAPTDSCWEHIVWPRVCTEDIGHGKEPKKVPILNRYGGECALRPFDALDFAVINNALGVAPPRRMSNWDVESRVAMRTAKEIVGALVPQTRALEAPPLVFQSLIDTNEKYALHLDAVRVLIRMLIRNPTLKVGTLPDLPGPGDVPGLLDVLSSDAADPVSINAAARAIERRHPENPFFKLLADGPTPDTRAMILARCPGPNDAIVGGHWIWEKGPQDPTRGKQFSMGWDCAFVGALYNKMRVKQDVAKQLIDLILKHADPVANATRRAAQALAAAQAAHEVQENIRKEAERKLKEADEFVNRSHARLRQELVDELNKAADAAAKIDQKVASLAREVARLQGYILTLPEEIEQRIKGKWCKYSIGCKLTERIKRVANPARAAAKKSLAAATKELTDLQSRVVKQATEHIVEVNKKLADLDARLQEAQQGLKNKVWEKQAELARRVSSVTRKAFDEARKQNAKIQRLDAQLQARIAVWRNDRKTLDALGEPPPVDMLAPEDRAKTGTRGAFILAPPSVRAAESLMVADR